MGGRLGSGELTHEQKRQSMLATLGEKTGRDIDGWLEVADARPDAAFMELVDWLKTEHGLGHFQARLVAEERRDRS